MEVDSAPFGSSAVDLACRRLSNLGLLGPPFESAAEVVGWLGGVQAQDYALAKWSVGQRASGTTDVDLDRLLDEGRIVRTHILRPTWHFVLPADVRWMQALTGPRVKARLGPRYRELELDEAELTRALAAISRALEGCRRLTRAQLTAALGEAGIALDVPRSTHMVMYAELDALICSGGLEGKEQTYALLDERVPPTRELGRDEALGELARRYFTSHGPSTIRDFTWWSSLTVKDARRAVEICRAELESQDLDGTTYWSGTRSRKADGPRGEPSACLLQAFDEFIVGYQATRTVGWDPNSFMDPIVVNGEAVGAWRRQRKKDHVAVETRLLRPLDPAEAQAVEAVVGRYGGFLGLPARLA